MMKFLNDAGTTLLVDFLNHMDNYSVMQIVQRLMLPHIPFNSQQEKETLPCESREEYEGKDAMRILRRAHTCQAQST